ncbi:MAG: peroxiredoxin [Bacillota bacterium]
MLQIGTPAPDFKAPDQHGQVQTLSQYRGSWVLLYFYPRDNTPGCTEEACRLRDNHPSFEKLDAIVLGVSTDSVQSHASFSSQHGLPFTIISDSEEKIVKEYGADGSARRISYLIDPEGNIAKIYPSVKPSKHAAEVLEDLATLQKDRAN